LELLNNLIIDKKYREEIKKQRRERKLFIKTPTVPDQDKVLNYSEIKLRLESKEIVDYINLSDGEHQFLNIFGTILMLDQDNILFLLDEPETHFNPKWRREFVKLWNEVTKGRIQDNFLTSHSPFVVSDSKKDKVYIFKKSDLKLEVLPPSKETYGASFDFVLKTAFDLDTTLSEKSFEEIKSLLESEDANEIEKRLSDFGESAEKFYLLKRIEELKLKGQRNASQD
jgi:restriction system-associated AAA family ATPase